MLQVDGEGDETALNIGEWFQYEVDLDIPLLRLPYDEKVLMLDMNTNGAILGSVVSLAFNISCFFSEYLDWTG